MKPDTRTGRSLPLLGPTGPLGHSFVFVPFPQSALPPRLGGGGGEAVQSLYLLSPRMIDRRELMESRGTYKTKCGAE